MLHSSSYRLLWLKRKLSSSHRYLSSLNRNLDTAYGTHELLSRLSIFRSTAFIGGKFINQKDEAELFEVMNPSTGLIVARVHNSTEEETNQAIESSVEAWSSWKTTTGLERGKLLNRIISLIIKHRDELAQIITLEMGKPFAEAKGEVDYAVTFFELFKQEASRITGEVLSSPLKGRKMMVIKQPVGPVALITPWNFPVAMIARKVAPALAAGCSMIIKPSEETPLCALAMCAIFEEAGLPAGVVNCLPASRERSPRIGEILCQSSYVRKISFTGSSRVGKILMRDSATTVKKLSLELGGNAPFVVFDDADIPLAVRVLLASKLRNAGQACIAPNRIFVQRRVYDKFIESLLARLPLISVGDGFDGSASMGPLVNQRGFDTVHAHVTDAVNHGAKLLCGGPSSRGGLFYLPTLLDGLTKDMRIFKEETFGPVLAIMNFDTEEEVAALANDTEFGLASYFCTQSLSRTFQFAEALESGMVGINEGTISNAVAPFGGVKESGLGREGSVHGIDEFLEMKYICIGLEK